MANTKKGSGLLALVTGASSGIGYELAKLFAEQDFTLLVAAEDGGIDSAAHAFREMGATVEALQVDLATAEGVDALYAKAKAMGLPIDSVVMNAGVGVGGEFVKTDLRRELNLIDLNIVSLVRLTKLVLPEMVARGRGRILYTSSVAGEMPGPYYAVYAASKAFVQSFAIAIRAEAKDTGVTVTALQPGATETNFFARADMLDTKAGRSEKDDPADVARDGFAAMMAGEASVVAGSLLNKVQVAGAKLATEKLGARMQGAQTKPGSGLPER